MASANDPDLDERAARIGPAGLWCGKDSVEELILPGVPSVEVRIQITESVSIAVRVGQFAFSLTIGRFGEFVMSLG